MALVEARHAQWTALSTGRKASMQDRPAAAVAVSSKHFLVVVQLEVQEWFAA
jgi:hypothetical protein